MVTKEIAKTEERGLIKLDQQVGTKGTLQALLQSAQDTIQIMGPKFMTPERVMKMVLIAASREPKLFECTQASVLQAAMDATEYGLDCSGKLGEGYLIPFWNSKINKLEAQFIPGYQGYIKLMCQHESVIFIESRIVYEDDEFTLNYGSDKPIHHIPELRPKSGQVVMGVYAIIHMVGGHQLCEWMNLSELHEIKRRALANKKNKQYSPWVTDEPAMQRKSVICRIQKYAPKTPELQAVAGYDNDIDDINRQVSAAIAENLTLPPTDAPGDDKNTSLVKKLKDQNGDESNSILEDLSDESKAVRDRYNAMCADPAYTDIAEVKTELGKLEGGDFSFHEQLTMTLDNIEDLKVKHGMKLQGKRTK